MKRTIIEASTKVAMRHGLEGWSLQSVADEAGCAKALVLHHFGSRARLLAETAATVQTVRGERRRKAMSRSGMASLDELWTMLTLDVQTGLSRATFALASQGYLGSRPEDWVEFHLTVATALGVEPTALADPVALAAMLDGIEFHLLIGGDREAGRAAFDRLWVTMLEIH